MPDRGSGLGILTAAVLVIVSISTGSSVAGIGKGNGEIGFDFGVTQFDDNVTDDSGARFSIRGGYFISDLFEIEGESSASGVAEVEGTNTDLFLSTLFVNGVFNFHPSEKTVPYVRVGLGLANLELSDRINIDDDGMAWQIAAGSRFFFGKRAAFRVDLSYMREDTFNEESDHVNLVVGFTWRLGKEN